MIRSLLSPLLEVTANIFIAVISKPTLMCILGDLLQELEILTRFNCNSSLAYDSTTLSTWKSSISPYKNICRSFICKYISIVSMCVRIFCSFPQQLNVELIYKIDEESWLWFTSSLFKLKFCQMGGDCPVVTLLCSTVVVWWCGSGIFQDLSWKIPHLFLNSEGSP